MASKHARKLRALNDARAPRPRYRNQEPDYKTQKRPTKDVTIIVRVTTALHGRFVAAVAKSEAMFGGAPNMANVIRENVEDFCRRMEAMSTDDARQGGAAWSKAVRP